MKPAFVTLSIVIIMSAFSADSQKTHIQKIKQPRTEDRPNKIFDMSTLHNQILIEEMKHTHLDLVFADALIDFRVKLLLLAGRARKLKLSVKEYGKLNRTLINEDNFEEMVKMKNYYKQLVNTQKGVMEIKTLKKHPLVHFNKVFNVLASWTKHFLVDVNGTKDMNEFYERMHLNAVKDSLGYMILFYYLFDARKFRTNMTFNYPRYRVALYHRIEKEMPYLLDNITISGDLELGKIF